MLYFEEKVNENVHQPPWNGSNKKHLFIVLTTPDTEHYIQKDFSNKKINAKDSQAGMESPFYLVKYKGDSISNTL